MKAAAVAGAVVLGVWVMVAWALVEEQPSVGAFASVLGVLGIWYAAAAAAIAYHAPRVARGPDLPARLAAFATAGRRGPSADWGVAMRAELASIDDPRERRTFALGCAWADLRTGLGRGPLLTGAVAALAFAIITFVASRVMLSGDRTGLLGVVLLGVPQLLFAAVGLLTARRTGSFRTGLEYGAVVLLAALAGILVVAIPESVRWYDEARVFLLDGDAPANDIPNPTAAIRDALSGLTFFFLLFTTPWPVLGAHLGARVR